MKFFTLLILFSFFISCKNNKPVSETVDRTQNDQQTQSANPALVTSAPDQSESQTEELYTITVRGDWPLVDNHIFDLYFSNIGSEVSIEKYFFTRDDLIQNNRCVVFRKSDFPNLSIVLRFGVPNDIRTLTCQNSYASTSKCSESATNLFLDLPEKAANGVVSLYSSLPLQTTSEKHPEIDKCYKLYR